MKNNPTPINFVDIDTRSGYRRFELHHADITNLGFKTDVLVVSAFRDDYEPVPNTVMGALYRKGVNVEQLAENPLLDFRSTLGVWVAEMPMDSDISNYLVCVEMTGYDFSYEEILENLFSILSILEVRKIKIKTISMPVIGAGNQGIDPNLIIPPILEASMEFLMHAKYAEKIMYVVNKKSKVEVMAKQMNNQLGRKLITMENDPFIEGIRKELFSEINKIRTIKGSVATLDDLARILETKFQPFELAGIARKTLEYMLKELSHDEESSLTLVQLINNLRIQAAPAPWIISYMHALRVFGNESLHHSDHKERKPAHVEAEDVKICLFCLQRVLNFYTQQM